MSILVNESTKIIIQGITGKQGSYHAARMLESKSHVVAGVSPGKGNQLLHGIPVYNTIKEAKRDVSIDASMIIVPPVGVYEAALEAINNEIPLVVIITEFVPVHDMMRLKNIASYKGIFLLGPNTIGVISPGKCKIGIMPSYLYSSGSIGIISRSGTLTHEVASNLTFQNIGQSTCVGIGGDPIKGINFSQVIELFMHDEQTEKIIVLGEIGGSDEELLAKYLADRGFHKDVMAFIAGSSAPPGKKMGHAGAIIARGMGTADSKISSLRKAGVQVANDMDELLEFAA